MDDFDLIIDPLASGDEYTGIYLTGTINNINAPGSEVTIDINWGDSTNDTIDIIDGGSDDADGAIDGSIGFYIPHIYDDDGTFSIGVNASEEILTGSNVINNTDSASETVTIEDVPDFPVTSNPITTDLNPVSGGTSGNDGLTGTDANDLLEALDGNDAIDGKAGNDVIDGGAGVDTAIYQFDPAAVSVNLAGGSAIDGYGGDDILFDIENIIGSEFDDGLTGSDEVNNLTGKDGNDTINARGGNDFLVGGGGNDTFSGGGGKDTFLYLNPAEGGDTINDFEVGSDKILVIGAVFPGGLSGGNLRRRNFFSGSTAVDANDRFGFDSATGQVLFDADGSGSGGAEVLATLANNPAGFSNADITVL